MDPVDRPAEDREDRRQERDRRQHGGEDADGTGVAERRDEWDTCDRQGDQGDDHRPAREHDRTAAGGDGLRDRVPR